MWTEELIVAIVDAAVAILTLALTSFLAPEWSEFALKVIAILQPVVLAIIAAMFAKKVAAIRAGSFDAYMASKRK